MHYRARSARAVGEFPIVLHEQVDEDNLDLGRGEESSRACVQAVAEPEMLGACRRQLVPRFVAGLLAQIPEAEAVEALCVRVYALILHDVRGDGDRSAFRDESSVG